MTAGFLLTLIGIVFFIVVPAFAISAYLRVRRLEQQRAEGGAVSHERLAALERRFAEVERKLGSAAGVPLAIPPEPPRAAATASRREAAGPIPQASIEQPPPAQTRALSAGSRGTRIDWEALIAGRWLNRLGIVAMLFAIGFFLKLAFDNQWVGNAGRVVIGLFLGGALLSYSQWLLRRGYSYFSEGIAGLGAGVLYLSLYAGWNYYHLFPQPVALVGMMAVTAAMAALALSRDSLRIALLALVGGFLTPVLLRTGSGEPFPRFSYLLVLDAGLLALARLRNWRGLEMLTFLLTQFFFWDWYARFYSPAELASATTFAVLFFGLFFVSPVWRARAVGSLSGGQTTLVLLNTLWFFLALQQMLWGEHRWALTLGVLGLAGADLVVAHTTKIPKQHEGVPARPLFYGLALVLATVAVPIRLEGKWVAMVWGVEAVMLVWRGLQREHCWLRWAGLTLLGLVAFHLWLFPIPAGTFLLNPRLGTFAVVVACFAAACWLGFRHRESLGGGERSCYFILGVTANVLAVWAFSLEVWDLFGRLEGGAGAERTLAQQMALSLFWILCASALILLGVRRRSAALRWQALVLFGLVVGKVFLYDLASLERAYRIVSFVVLGVMLLVVSFFYEKRLAARSQGGDGG